MMRLRNSQRRGLVALRSDYRFQDLAFMVDSAPEIAELAVDLHERLIQMPPPLRIPAHVRYPPFSDLSAKHRAESVPPKPDRLIADLDPALGQEILDVAQRQRVLHVRHYDQTDHFWRAVEIPERVSHGLKLPQPNTARKIALTVPSATARLNQFCGLPANGSLPDVDDKALTHTPTNASVFRIVAVAEQAVADDLHIETDSNHKPQPAARLPRI